MSAGNSLITRTFLSDECISGSNGSEAEDKSHRKSAHDEASSYLIDCVGLVFVIFSFIIAILILVCLAGWFNFGFGLGFGFVVF